MCLVICKSFSTCGESAAPPKDVGELPNLVKYLSLCVRDCFGACVVSGLVLGTKDTHGA